jgi:hypothetical protein
MLNPDQQREVVGLIEGADRARHHRS